jgi:hypothetical protein
MIWNFKSAFFCVVLKNKIFLLYKLKIKIKEQCKRIQWLNVYEHKICDSTKKELKLNVKIDWVRKGNSGPRFGVIVKLHHLLF